MANIPLKSIQFPDLPDTYIINPSIAEVDGLQDALDEKADKTDVYNGFVSENIQGSIASFDDGADDIPVKSLVADIVPVQSGSGDPSPDNVRAISGWTECNVFVTAKNLFNKNNYTYVGGFFSSGKITSNASHTITYIPCEPNTAYTASRERTANNERFAIAWTKELPQIGTSVYDVDKASDAGTVGETESVTTITGADAKYIAVWGWWTGSVQSDAEATLQIEKGATPTAYEPFGSTHTIPFASAGTVYGGSIDVTTGVLTVDKAMVDLGTLEYEVTSADRIRTEALKDIAKLPASTSVPANMIAEKYKCIPANGTLVDGTFAFLQAGVTQPLVFYYDGVNQPTGKLVYKLATPQTYQLTPTEVKTLLGNNNVWADTGDIDLTYRADLGLYLDKIINA